VNSHRLIVIALLAIACAGCATRTPVAQVRLVGKAFEHLNGASAPLFDDLAVAERINGKNAADVRVKKRAANGTIAAALDRCKGLSLAEAHGDVKVQVGFCGPDSYYYSELADPPATASFRRSIAAIQGYTNVLLILAEGRNLEAAQAEVQALAGNVGGVLEIAGAGAAGAALEVFTTSIQPLLDIAAKRANAKELARAVKQVSPKAVDVITKLRETAPELFTMLTEQSLKRFRDIEGGLKVKAIAEAEAYRMESYRNAVSNYVVLLDQYESLLKQLVAAYDTEGKVVTLAGLVEQSAQLSAQADAWRRTYSALRMRF
jgi:hypothetical protein